jgi:hypothetical protein
MNHGTPGTAGAFEFGDGQLELSRVIDGMREGLEYLEERLSRLTLETQLGTGHGARVITPYNQDVAANAENGLLAQLAGFRETLGRMTEALAATDTTYQGTEQDNVRELGCP